MMTKRKALLLCFVFVLTNMMTVQAQTKFELPQNVALNTDDDYAKYETAIIEAAKWLEATDLNKETDKRQQINTFVLQWVSGSPDIIVAINEQLVQLYGNNPQLLGMYIASYTRNFLENKNTATTFSATKAGLISMMNVYKKGIEISKRKEMDKLIKLTDKQLDDYINKNFK